MHKRKPDTFSEYRDVDRRGVAGWAFGNSEKRTEREINSLLLSAPFFENQKTSLE